MTDLIKDYLHAEIEVHPKIDDDMTLAEALDYFIENTVEWAIVTKNQVPLGLLSDTAIISHRKDANFATRTCGDLVTVVRQNVLGPNEPMEVAAELVSTYHNVDQILIQTLNRVDGILLKHDILRWMKAKYSEDQSP